MEDVNLSRSPEISVKDFYEIEKTSQFVNPFSIVALQFPDQLLPDSVEIVGLLQELNPTVRFYILADTSYGSECVDEVAAEHILAQCIVHYGRAVVVPTTRLPVYYVFGRYPIDANDCMLKLQAFLNNQPGEIEALLFYESYYSYIIPEFEGKLNNTLITKIPTSTIGKSKDNNEDLTGDFWTQLMKEDERRMKKNRKEE